MPVGQTKQQRKWGDTSRAIAKTKKRPATAGLFSLSSPSPHNIRGFAQPRLVEATNTVGEDQR